MSEEPGTTRTISEREECLPADPVTESGLGAPVRAHPQMPPFRNLVLREPAGKTLCEGEGLKALSTTGEEVEDTSADQAGISNGVTPPRSLSTSPFRSLILREPLGKVLYRDEAIIRQVYDSVAAAVNRASECVTQPRSRAMHALQQQLVSLEWKPRSDTNFDYLVLLLSSCVEDKETVSGLIYRIRMEREDKFHHRFVHPAMPIRVRGFVQRENDVSKKRICLRDGESSVYIILDKEHSLHQDPAFLVGRSLFVLGVVQNLRNEVIIEAGALLL